MKIIMKLTWLVETGHLEKAVRHIIDSCSIPELKNLIHEENNPLHFKTFKGHHITRILKQYLPSVKFKGFPIQKLDVPQLKREAPFKSLLDLMFTEDFNSQFKYHGTNFKNRLKEVMKLALTNKQHLSKLTILYCLGFAYYQFEICKTVIDFCVKHKIAMESFETFLFWGSKYGEKNIADCSLQLIQNPETNNSIDLQIFFKESIKDVELIKIFADSINYNKLACHFKYPLYDQLIESPNPLIISSILNLDQKSIPYDSVTILSIIRKLAYLGNYKVGLYLDLMQEEKIFIDFFALVKDIINLEDIFDQEELIILLLKRSINSDLDTQFRFRHRINGTTIFSSNRFTLVEASAYLGFPKLLNYLIQRDIKNLPSALNIAISRHSDLNENHKECIQLLTEKETQQALTRSNLGLLTSSTPISHSTINDTVLKL